MAQKKMPCILVGGPLGRARGAMDPLDFLRQHAPFSELSISGCARLAEHLEIDYVTRDHEFLREGGEPAAALFVLRKGVVEARSSTGDAQRLGPGDCFGYESLLSERSPTTSARAVDDCLVFRVPAVTYGELVRDEPGFAGYFLHSLAERLRTRREPSTYASSESLTASVGTLIQRDAVTGPTTLSIREAAAIMAEHGISSLLLFQPPHPDNVHGIVTDRDLRRRVVAQDIDGARPVAAVMSHPVVTLPRSATLFDAMLLMVKQRVHHLPVVDASGRPIGVITHDDLLRHVFHSPASTLARVRRARLDGPPIDHAGDVAGLVAQLHRSQLGAMAIGAMVASLNDVLVGHLCQLAEQRLGPPPVPYAWIVFGSEGRREQALLTDQDNALVFANGGNADHTPYFRSLADIVVSQLIASGIPPCAGGYMATNWCYRVDEWVATFARWAATPSPTAVMHAANLFDFRAVSGELVLDALEQAVTSAAKEPRFMAHFAAQVLSKRPQGNVVSRWLDLDRTVDLKAEALVPIVGLARVYALVAGQRAGTTLERLQHAAAQGELDSDRAESLAEAFEFVFRLRLEHQLTAHRAGSPTNNELRLASLPALDRRHLRDCLAYVADAQRSFARRFGTDHLG